MNDSSPILPTSKSPTKGADSAGRVFLDHMPESAKAHELVLKVVPMPADCNANGDIFGGWVMSQVDIAGAIAAFRIANGRIATVAVNEFVFKQPVRVGDILSFYAAIERVGRTSIAVRVEVYAEHFQDQGRYLKVTEATLTYVAIDANGQSRQVIAPRG